MPTIKHLRTPLIVMFGMIMAVALAGPANAADAVYPPPAGTTVLGASVTANPPATVAVAGVSESAGETAGELAFTGANAMRLGALGGLLLVGGGVLVVAGKRRKVNA